MAALGVITEHLARGRWAEARQPTHKELLATAVTRIHIDSASAKWRSGPPNDDEADYSLPVWAGVLPFEVSTGTPESDARLAPNTPIPSYVRAYRRKRKD
jgi:hypothetical protein